MKKSFLDVASAIGIVVTVILVLAVLMPITNTFIGAGGATAAGNLTNLTGYTGANTVAQQYPIMIIIGLLIAIVSLGFGAFLGRV